MNDVDSDKQSCWVGNDALVLDSDGEDVLRRSSVKLHAVTLALLIIVTLTDEFTVNVESVVVVGYDDDVGRKGPVWSVEILTEIGRR